MFPSLNSWKESTAQAVIGVVPLQGFDSSLVLAEEYLSDTGGWSPDDPLQPTGAGQPVSGVTPQEAATLILESQLDRIYQTQLTTTVDLSVSYHTNQGRGLSDSALLATIEAELRDFIEQKLSGTGLVLEDLNTYAGTVTVGGRTDASTRVSLNASVLSGDELADIRASVLSEARILYALDQLWNVEYLYSEPSSGAVVSIRKYEDTTYQGVDSSETSQYILKVNPVTNRIQTGMRKPL